MADALKGLLLQQRRSQEVLMDLAAKVHSLKRRIDTEDRAPQWAEALLQEQAVSPDVTPSWAGLPRGWVNETEWGIGTQNGIMNWACRAGYDYNALWAV